MFDFLWNLGSFIVALGILITAHEYGHFWVARRCGVKVERFSIGFGKALWRKVGQDGTEYVIAMIPLGGYVKMLDERVDTVAESLKSQAFNRKTVWQRIAIVAAGPIANFLFAIIALYFMYLIGVPSVKPVIDTTLANTPAAQIKLSEYQEIITISGQKVRNWDEVNLALIGHIGEDEIDIELAPLSRLEGMDTGSRHHQLDIRHWQFDPEKQSPITSLGLGIFRPQVLPELAVVAKGSAAERGGILPGDTLMAINGSAFDSWESFVTLIQGSTGKAVLLTVKRGMQTLDVDLVPDTQIDKQGRSIGVLGVSPTQAKWPENMRISLEYGIVDSIFAAVDKTWQLIVVSFKMIAKLFTGDVSVKNLSGPISIAQGAGASADYGLVYFLGFIALISVNLGIINLLPLPVLDGGHLLYYFIEVITGRPVPEKAQEIGFRIGAAMLLMLMSIALFNDFARL
ncbi:RseP peptidase. Metallo peptidase. MEROPS family M50B [Shewanella denitrificans OS217]|jgi:regulator of sigma E protease|uniref:Zinc metalloprotease n=1 Tax=Shewanella denitrificans (strain OS217 / ATCC BAA-1090 / DSM 15013) TaxID=318161 RepID=Q12NY0_SHEDO|nr:sigma E protease regulator RseP [Shewanella denitrificans]ABE54846.1 RseP peptidase. Metallo peptidase. MEROPS family M50B [Shewanella denitrificans OS217]